MNSCLPQFIAEYCISSIHDCTIVILEHEIICNEIGSLISANYIEMQFSYVKLFVRRGFMNISKQKITIFTLIKY